MTPNPPFTGKRWQNLHEFGSTRQLKMLFLAFLLLILGAFFMVAFTGTVTTFSDGNVSANLTLDANYQNTTIYIDVPLDGYAFNLTIYIEGLNTTP